MRTLFTRSGKEITFVHNVDARESLERGNVLEKRPGVVKPKKRLKIRKSKASKVKAEVVGNAESKPLIVDEGSV